MPEQNLNNIRVESDDVEKLEEEILAAAKKAGKDNVIVNIFAYPGSRLKRRWHIRYKFNKKHLVMDALIAAAVLVLIGLNIFWWRGGFNYFLDKLEVTISSEPANLVSGGSAVFAIEYHNNNKYKLEDAVLSVKRPSLFVLDNVSRSDFDLTNNTLKIGTLEPGANGRIEFKGQTLGGIEDKQFFAINFNYFKTDKKGARLWGQFQKNAVYDYVTSGSYLSFESTPPDKVVNNQAFDWKIKIINNSQNLIYKKLRLEPNFDTEFTLVGQGDLAVNDFVPGAARELILRAKIKTEQATKPMGLDIYWEGDGFSYKQMTWSRSEEVFQPRFEVGANVLSDKTVNPGDWVDFSLTYDNQGKYSIENAQIGVELSGNYWDLKNVKKDGGVVSSNKIIWGVADVPRFALIQPGEKGEIKFSVKTREYVADSAELSLRYRATSAFRVEENDVDLATDFLGIKLNSNLAVLAYPLYYAKSGDQLGRGPIPPRVGEETKYWVFVKLVNDINPVSEVSVSAELPFNVSWNDRSSVPVGNAIVYDAGTKKITWQISEVPVKPTNIGFAFEVGIIPTAGQAGTYPLLLQNIWITGKDKVTGKDIVKELGGVSTKLSQDVRGKLRDGVVAK